MNTDELTQIVTAHQQVIVRSETRLDRIEAILESVAQQQQVNTQAIAQNQQAIAQNQQAIAQNQQAIAQNQQAIATLIAAQELTRQDISQLTAGIESLRHQVADWMSSRNQS